MNYWAGGESYIADQNFQGHKERLKRVRATVDTSLPVSVRQFVPKSHHIRKSLETNGKKVE
jgi:indole-3-glycerol phosphate synthase